MKRRVLWGVQLGLLSVVAACGFEPPAVQPFLDAAPNDDAGFTDTNPADAEGGDAQGPDGDLADLGDAGDLGPPDEGPTDLPPPDAGRAPVAVAGPGQVVCPGDTVRLDGAASMGDALAYAWSQESGPAVVLEDANTSLASFVAPPFGTLGFELLVTNDLASDRDTTQVQVLSAPSFELGPSRRVRAGEAVLVTVPSSTTSLAGATFQWVQRSGPDVVLGGADTATVSFTAPAAGEIVELELTVTSTCGQEGRDTLFVTVNRPPNAVAAMPPGALPHDTVLLDASGSSDQDQDALSFEWSLLSAPAGHQGGFEPFPGTGNTSSLAPAPSFHPTLPGVYLIELSVSDGLESDTTSTFVEVSGFELLPYPNDAARLDTRALAVRPSDGNVFIGTTSGAQEYRHQTDDLVALACVGSNSVTVVRAAPGGRLYFGFEGQRRITELAAGGGCVSQTHDPGSVLNPNPSSTRDIFVTRAGDLYVATDQDVAFFSRTSTAFTQEIFFTALGGANSDFSAVGQDGSGQFWFGSREANTIEDGVVRVLNPGTAPPSTPRIDLLTGNDDVNAFLSGLVAPPAFNEYWVFSRTRGILQLPDADAPSSFRHYTILNGGLPPSLLQDELTRGVYEAGSQDVWVAMRSGIARYKRDVDAFVAIPLAVLGVTGRVYDVALDEGTPRGRVLYIATRDGVLRAVGAP